jgi:hypothetical protein
MTNPVAWARGRLGERRAAIVLLALLLVLAVVPVVALPAARCEVFGSGCRTHAPQQRADPVAATRAPTPLEAAKRGSYVALGDSYSAGVGAEATPADHNPLACCQTRTPAPAPPSRSAARTRRASPPPSRTGCTSPRST